VSRIPLLSEVGVLIPLAVLCSIDGLSMFALSTKPPKLLCRAVLALCGSQSDLCLSVIIINYPLSFAVAKLERVVLMIHYSEGSATLSPAPLLTLSHNIG
jgi:hypothetical protein